ncbi:MAG: ribose-phosphate diphosphokinase [Janthinobacterium lividum]
MKIIAGSTHHGLAKRVASLLDAPLIKPLISRFSDSEFKVQIIDDIRDDDVYIIQSTSEPVNENLVELLLLIDTARCAGANKITAIIPYFGYSRQDHTTYNYGPLPAQLVINLIQHAGAEKVIVIDIHSSSVLKNSTLLIQNLSPSHLFTKLISSSSPLIVGPDVGSTDRVQILSSHTGWDFIIFNKIRTFNDNCIISSEAISVEGRDCILIDDIIDTGNTICQAATYLRYRGAASVKAFVTHIISQDVSDYVAKNSTIESIYVTDTIVHKNLHSKFCVLSVDRLIVNSISQHKNTI